MELTDSQQLTYLVETLTTSGNKELDKPNLKKFKSICKKSDEHVKHAFHLIMTQLEKEHSEIRLSALFLADELFHRSHVFRELLLDNFHEFLELTAETNFDMPLPEPKTAAKEVVKNTLKCVKCWYEKFGPAYKKLELGYNFLKGTKKIQLINADEVQTQIQRNAQEERNRRKDTNNNKRIEKVIAEIDSNIHEIQNCIAEIEACFSLLVPNFAEEDEWKFDSEEFDKQHADELRESGLISHDYRIELDLSENILNFIKVKENKDNGVILENLQDREKVLRNLYLPKVKRWLVKLGTCGAPSEVLKRVIDVKLMMTKSLEKSKDLIMIHEEGTDVASTSGTRSENVISQMSDDDSSDDDFIEVQEKPKLAISKHSARVAVEHDSETKPSSDINIWKPLRDDDNISDPASYTRALIVQKKKLRNSKTNVGTAPSKLQKIHPKKSSASQNGIKNKSGHKMLDSAPFVSFGPDLLEWDETRKKELKELISFGAAKDLDIGHRFYGSQTAASGDGGVSEAALSALTTRSIAFVGEFEPVKWSCRAPISNGKLCPRKDRLKCPFHGPIIPRNLNGDPSSLKVENQQTHMSTSTTEDWQDPELLRELKIATGIDLKMPEKKRRKGKGKKRKYENLTNVEMVKNTSRSRLQKKVLDSKSLKRVSETLDSLDTKRNMQKFGNNFNYALN